MFKILFRREVEEIVAFYNDSFPLSYEWRMTYKREIYIFKYTKRYYTHVVS